MNLQNRIDLMVELGNYIKQNSSEWQEAKFLASKKNGWFTENFIDISANNIADKYLDKKELTNWVRHYHLDDNIEPKNVGIVMAGNIPMVGFHDFLSVFTAGHKQSIKLSGKDDVLLKHLIEKLYSLNEETKSLINTGENLKGCDAYITTGGNQSATYFEQYFSKYPNIIRRNRTSLALLTGEESKEELLALSDDIHLYFGLGCRNVTKIFVPRGYDFIPLLESFNKYLHLKDYSKYMNNYDYQLSILLLNKKEYMTNGCTLMVEESGIFSAIGVVHYEYYDPAENIENQIKNNPDVQCVVGKNHLPFGKAQEPGLFNYADGVDILEFLLSL